MGSCLRGLRRQFLCGLRRARGVLVRLRRLRCKRFLRSLRGTGCVVVCLRSLVRVGVLLLRLCGLGNTIQVLRESEKKRVK